MEIRIIFPELDKKLSPFFDDEKQLTGAATFLNLEDPGKHGDASFLDADELLADHVEHQDLSLLTLSHTTCAQQLVHQAAGATQTLGEFLIVIPALTGPHEGILKAGSGLQQVNL